MIDLPSVIAQINRLHLPATALDSLLAVQPEPAARVPVTAGSLLQPIIDAAADGTELVLEPGAYTGALTIGKPVTLTAAYVPRVRVSPDQPSPVAITAPTTIRVPAMHVRLAGVTLRVTDPTQTILDTRLSLGVALDACHILGDPVKGQRRGIAWNGVGTFMRRSAVDYIFAAGVESQAVCGWAGCRDGRIDDSLLCGAAQSVLWGGSDCPSPADSPTNLVISHSTLSKRREWLKTVIWIKAAFEAKNAWNCRLEDSICEYAGTSEQQKGYLFVLTPRNQGGHAPWSAVRDVTIERVLARYGGGCVSFLGTDDTHPSGPLEGVTIRNVRFENIDPQGITKGDGRAFMFNRGPRGIMLDSLTVSGRNLKALLYGTGAPPVGLRVRNVVAPVSVDYGLKIDSGSYGLGAWQTYAPDCVIDDGPLTGASGYPTA